VGFLALFQLFSVIFIQRAFCHFEPEHFLSTLITFLLVNSGVDFLLYIHYFLCWTRSPVKSLYVYFKVLSLVWLLTPFRNCFWFGVIVSHIWRSYSITFVPFMVSHLDSACDLLKVLLITFIKRPQR
jgi:hypothetical protein